MSDSTARVIEMQPQESGEKLREQVKTLLAEGVTQTQIAKEIDMSPSAINGWVKGSYQGDNEKLEAKIEQWLAGREERKQVTSALPAKPDFLELEVAQKITHLLSYTQMTANIGVVYGPPGVGKSKALWKYAKDRPNVWIVTGRPSIKCVASFLVEIARKMKIARVNKRAAMLTDELIFKLKGTGGLIIVDEAQHLTAQTLEELRCIKDCAEIGVVLAGNEYVYARLAGDGTAVFAQFFSRIGRKLRLKKPSENDIKAICQAMGVTEPMAQKYCVEIAHKPEAMRGMIETIQVAALFANGAGQELGLKHIKAAWKDREQD
ncbi:B transposition protein domain protein [Desulfatibacillum aliphaticivorans]|uniref:B transposition protein domain protein n=1 Tax=Desulfatibacillum aliphaticivorans TaxID=218208 RepID=B8FGN5_DESAL|nr:AAA family ATPase [Desulfatibacillum aliphaticivorans]ACL05265.1 B transposition protein domain protein [Desulfatibacillum aliphaticivorans]